MSKLRKSANGRACIRCEREDMTIVSAHYSGPWQHRFGKGRGIKGDDIAAADFCLECHSYFDEYKGVTDELTAVQRSEEFLGYCLLTVMIKRQSGIVKL